MGGKDNEPQPITPGDDYAYNVQDSPPKKSWLARNHSILIAAFLLVNVIVLYILHFADRGSSGSSSSDATTSTFTSTALSSEQSASGSASKGQAVSLDASGKLTVGAGTTAYLAAATLPSEDQYMAYIKFAPLGTTESTYATNLVSYQLGTSPDITSVLTTFSVDSSAKTVTLADAETANELSGATIKGLTTLSDAKAVALSSVTSTDGMSYSVYVTPVTIADDKVTLEQEQTTFAINNSATNFMTRLSDSTFAVAYYEPYTADGYYQRVLVGSVADDNSLSFSDSVQFGNENLALYTTFGTPKAITGDSEKFTIPWFVEGMDATKDNQTIAGSVGLCLFTANFSANTIVEADSTCDMGVEPAFYVDSARLEDNAIALIFFNRADNFALTVLIAEFSSITGIPTFRGSYVIEEATGAYDFGWAAYGFYPTPTLRSLPNNRLAVGFLNPSDSGKPSVKVLAFGSDFAITEVSPVLPVANEDFSVSSADPNAYGAIVLDSLPVASGFVVSYAGLWAGAQNQRIALVESLGKPVGVVSDASSSELTVAMSGTVDVSDVTAGTAYYAATSGDLYASTSSTADDFILAQDNTIVISKDALVGVAVSGSSLIVTV